jgi:hypothetical protein
MLCAPSAFAEPPDFDLSHHPATALAPGVGIGIYDSDGRPTDTCTAGWLVHDSNGQPGLLTAGHCDNRGPASYFNETKGFQIVGWFNHRVYDGDTGGDDDIAVLGIGNGTNAPSVPTDTRIVGIRPVSTTAGDIHLSQGRQLCHYGLITGSRHGRPECGPIVEVQPNTVRFAAPVDKGDSGGPVYYRNADGTATPVGVTIRAGTDGGTVAEVIGPWLKRWNLRLDSG